MRVGQRPRSSVHICLCGKLCAVIVLVIVIVVIIFILVVGTVVVRDNRLSLLFLLLTRSLRKLFQTLMELAPVVHLPPVFESPPHSSTPILWFPATQSSIPHNLWNYVVTVLWHFKVREMSVHLTLKYYSPDNPILSSDVVGPMLYSHNTTQGNWWSETISY